MRYALLSLRRLTRVGRHGRGRRGGLDEIAHHLPFNLFQGHRPVPRLTRGTVRWLAHRRGRHTRAGSSLSIGRRPSFSLDLFQRLVSGSRVASLLGDGIEGAVGRGRVAARMERRGRRDVPAGSLLLTKSRGCQRNRTSTSRDLDRSSPYPDSHFLGAPKKSASVLANKSEAGFVGLSFDLLPYDIWACCWYPRLSFPPY